MTDPTGMSDALRGDAWRALGDVATAHALMLRDVAMLDDAALGTLLVAIDSARAGAPAEVGLPLLATRFEERVDGFAPAAAGVGSVGRGVADTLATVARVLARDGMLDLLDDLAALRATLEETAIANISTFLPATSASAPAQPTSFGHMVAAVLAEVERATDATLAALALVDRSPLGAGALVGTGFPIDREQAATRLGFGGVVEQTIDAVSAMDHWLATAAALERVVAPLGRWLDELLVWNRTDPLAFTLGAAWTMTDPGLPQWTAPTGIVALSAAARQAAGQAGAIRAVALGAPWGPALAETGALIVVADQAVASARRVVQRTTALMRDGLTVNRAWFANRSGRQFVTASDLADFLLVEEQLDPGSARRIASLALNRAQEAGVEISGVTPEMIDTAAMMIVGREIGVEMEALSRYLAPRRFVERRNVGGGPAPSSLRSWVAGAAERRTDVGTRVASVRAAIAHASAGRAEALAAVEGAY
jgi:argininosuccinate lyase